MKTFCRLLIISLSILISACGNRIPSFETLDASSTDGSGSSNPGSDVNGDGSFKKIKENLSVTATTGSADILFVIDNSASMTYEQRNMAQRFTNMLNALDGLDWQIAITTTETGGIFGTGGNLLPFTNTLRILNSQMDKTTADQLFRQTIQRPETGTATERGITAVSDALNRIGQNINNTTFFRSKSHLAVVIISDEDESFEFFSRTTPAELLSAVKAKLGDNKSFTAHSIITKPNDFVCLGQNGASFGNQYAQLSLLTGGVVGSVCETDYAKQLSDIGKNVVKKSRPTVNLKCLPADVNGDGSPDILLDDVSLPESSYSIENGQLFIDPSLEVGDYEVTYYCK